MTETDVRRAKVHAGAKHPLVLRDEIVGLEEERDVVARLLPTAGVASVPAGERLHRAVDAEPVAHDDVEHTRRSTARSTRESRTLPGSSTSALPPSIACQTRSTTYSGSSTGARRGPVAPANMPVEM